MSASADAPELDSRVAHPPEPGHCGPGANPSVRSRCQQRCFSTPHDPEVAEAAVFQQMPIARRQCTFELQRTRDENAAYQQAREGWSRRPRASSPPAPLPANCRSVRTRYRRERHFFPWQPAWRSPTRGKRKAVRHALAAGSRNRSPFAISAHVSTPAINSGARTKLETSN